MTGVLIVGHGSRQEAVGQALEAVADAVRARLPQMVVETAYMEFSPRDIPFGLERLVERGACKIAVVPCFLFEGIHIRKNIPQELERFKQANPGIKITMGKPLGTDERLAEILADRAIECLRDDPHIIRRK